MTDQKTLRERLLEERERVLAEIAELDADLSQSLEDASGDSPNDQHMAEAAGATLDREIELTLQGNAHSALAKIDRALRKLEEGTYGKCDKCGEAIAKERLEIAPYAALCVECKRQEERAL